MTSVAIMQPYLFPYWPYFKMMAEVDAWIVLDNVQHRPRGFIHRNAILLHGRRHPFTLPLHKASQHDLISDLRCHDLDAFIKAFFTTLHHAYHRAPQYDFVRTQLDSVFQSDSVLDILLAGLDCVRDVYGITTTMHLASDIAIAPDLHGQARIIALCQALGADRYVNLPGGRDIYSTKDFSAHGIELAFFTKQQPPYTQFAQPFVGQLSIIDTMMFDRSWDAICAEITTC